MLRFCLIDLYKIIIVLVFILSQTLSVKAEETNRVIPDSLLTYEYMIDVYMDDPDLAQDVLNTIRERELDVPDYTLDYMQACIYWRVYQYHLSLYYYERHLQYDEVKKSRDRQLRAMSAILATAILCDDHSKLSKYAQLIIEMTKDAKDNTSRGILASAYYHLGRMYWELLQFDKAMEYYDEAILLLTNIDEAVFQEFLTDYCINISLDMQYANEFEMALKYNELVKETIERLQGMPKSEDGVLEQYPVMYNILMANTLAGLKRTSEADQYYENFLALPEEDRYYLASFINIYLFETGRYEEIIQSQIEALEIYQANEDTITSNVLGLKSTIAKTYYQMGKYGESTRFYRDIVDLKDSLNIREKISNIREFSVIHDVWGKENEIQEQKASIEKRNLSLAAVSIILILLLIALIMRVQSLRRLKEKNIGLVKQIHEQDRLNKELKEERAEMEKLRRVFKEKNGMEETTDEKAALFEQLEMLMDEKHPYTDPSLNRKTLADMLGTNEKYLRETIKSHLEMTVNEYITLLRLRNAKELLIKTASEYTIEAVAIDSGFGSRTTFHKLFRDHYGLTPDEFRRIVQSND